MEKIKCFFAYPSVPVSHSEIIEAAIEELNNGQILEVIGWKKTSNTGKFIIIEICREIESCDLVLFDLTNLNNNVLFELGYAVARDKRIFIFLDPSIEKAKSDFEKFNLTTIGYSSYCNKRDIVKALYKEQPFNDLKDTLYRQSLMSIIKPSRKASTLLYLKSEIDTEASIKLSRRIIDSKINHVIDDPQEVRIHPLSWYVEEVTNSFCVISHFLDQNRRGQKLHNAKISFISGMAYGLDKKLLMLAHLPFISPIDYKELLKTHRTASECEKIVDQWLSETEKKYIETKKADEEYTYELQAHSLLKQISVGDYIAEQEREEISKYFVETSIYKEALNSINCIFIGRKGSGKSAILYKLKDELSTDKRNHICLIKPIGYELEGLLRMMQQSIPISEKGFLVESFWKFLVYTELAKSVYEKLIEKPGYYNYSEEEISLRDLVDQNDRLIKSDFSIRLEYAVNQVKEIGNSNIAAEKKLKISELLHDEIIWKLRKTLGKVLHNKNRVCILIDNLDKNWKKGADLKILCHLLLGLFSVSQRMCNDFKRSDSWRKKVQLSITIFLRSDIFSYIMQYARERDKISYARINWDDPLLLLRVIEERFKSNTSVAPGEDIWKKYFCSTVGGVDIKDFIIQNIIPRPRDIIYVVKTALANAVNHKHTKIEEVDILSALKSYSKYALDSLLVENGISLEDFEGLVYEFVGMPEVINGNDIRNAMKKCLIPLNIEKDVLDLLCDRTFIGREVAFGDFRFQYNIEDRNKLDVMSRKTAESRTDKLKRFRINKAFHSYLEIKSSD